MKRTPKAISLLLIQLFFLTSAHAQSMSVGAGFTIESTSLKTLIVETVYPLKVSRYATPSSIVLLGPGANRSSRATPEEVVQEMLSSMRAKDWDWNSSLWTKESLEQMKSRDAARNKTPSDWIKTWAQEDSLSYRAMTRIDYGKYVLVEYAAVKSDGHQAYKDTIALERFEGRWALTQALAADPVLMNWNAPSGRVQVSPSTYLPIK